MGGLTTRPAVLASGLTKSFRSGRHTVMQRIRREPDQRRLFTAVDGIDLRVDEGEIFGILGPNGAGKTTTMRMLATLLEPTGGTATILGLDVRREARRVRASLGCNRQADEREEEVMRLKAKIGDITMENELLREEQRRLKQNLPLASRRSRT